MNHPHRPKHVGPHQRHRAHAFHIDQRQRQARQSGDASASKHHRSTRRHARVFQAGAHRHAALQEHRIGDLANAAARLRSDEGPRGKYRPRHFFTYRQRIVLATQQNEGIIKQMPVTLPSVWHGLHAEAEIGLAFLDHPQQVFGWRFDQPEFDLRVKRAKRRHRRRKQACANRRQ